MNKPDMTQPASCHTGLYTTYISLAFESEELKEATKKALESQCRELQATMPEVIASWLNEMAELHR